MPQVLLNYAPVSRKAWRLKALIDEKGSALSCKQSPRLWCWKTGLPTEWILSHGHRAENAIP